MAHQLVLDALDHGALLVDQLHAVFGEGIDEVHVVEVEGGEVLVVLYADRTPYTSTNATKRTQMINERAVRARTHTAHACVHAQAFIP